MTAKKKVYQPPFCDLIARHLVAAVQEAVVDLEVAVVAEVCSYMEDFA